MALITLAMIWLGLFEDRDELEHEAWAHPIIQLSKPSLSIYLNMFAIQNHFHRIQYFLNWKRSIIFFIIFYNHQLNIRTKSNFETFQLFKGNFYKQKSFSQKTNLQRKISFTRVISQLSAKVMLTVDLGKFILPRSMFWEMIFSFFATLLHRPSWYARPNLEGKNKAKP